MPAISIDATLRQFARAVTADRLVGDELVGAVLAGAAITTGAQAPRGEKFREFFRRWRNFLEDKSAPRPFSKAALVKSIGGAPSEARLVLLLRDICGLSAPEVETAIGPLSRPQREILADERRAIGARNRPATAVVIEDEPLIAVDIQDILAEMGVNVVALARTASAGAAATLKHRPDIVIADFNLDGGATGVDAVVAFQDEHPCPVVFITGYPDQVLKGEEVEPDFVIVKPYLPESVRAAVAHSLDTARRSVHATDESPMRGDDDEK